MLVPSFRDITLPTVFDGDIPLVQFLRAIRCLASRNSRFLPASPGKVAPDSLLMPCTDVTICRYPTVRELQQPVSIAISASRRSSRWSSINILPRRKIYLDRLTIPTEFLDRLMISFTEPRGFLVFAINASGPNCSSLPRGTPLEI